MTPPIDEPNPRLQALNAARFSRRQLLKRSVAFGLTVPALGSLLAACGDDDDDETPEPSSDPTATTAAPAADPTEDGADDEPTAEAEATADDAEEETPDDTEEETPETDGEETPAAGGGGPGDGVRGGTLRVVLTGDLGTFDTQAVTQSVIGYVAWHIWEHLFTYDEDVQLTPELADTHEVSDDGLTHTITVREANFHNGKAMTAEDVVASIERWSEVSPAAGSLAEATDEIVTVDERTLEFHLNAPFGILTTVLARQNSGCVIFPSEIMEEIGTEPLTNYEHFIGTGTYEFVEHQPDRHIQLRRFEDYVSRQEPSSGYAGFKNQYVDEIFFIPVTDEAASVAGMLAGDYNYAESLAPIQYDALASSANVTLEMLPAPSWGCYTINFREGILSGAEGSGLLLRQAILATLDMEEIAIGAYGDGWYRLHPSVSFEGLPWETEAGGEFYNQADPDRARELMDEAGYNNEPIIWITTREYQDHYDTTVLAVQQLEDAGFTIDLQLYDWATVGERRLDPSLYNISTTAHTFRADPIQLTPIPGPEHDGWWDSPRKNEATIRFQTEHEFEKRFEIWEEIQTLWYEEVPRIKVADQRGFHAMSANLRGWDPTVQIRVAHWNHWLEE